MNHTISDTDYVELSTFAEKQWHKVLNYLGRTFNLPREDCQDVFQDAFIVLYDQINEGRVHAQTYTKAELTQAAYNIQQEHNEGAKICLTYKAQVEASKAWTEEIRQNYLFAIQSLLEYYSMQKRYTDEEELLNHAIALYNTRDSITNNPQTRALHTMQTRVQFDKKNYDALIGYAKKALNMYNAVGDHGIDYCILCCNTSLAYVEQDDEQHATQYIDEAFNCQQKFSAQFNLSKYMGYYPIQNQRGYVYLIFGMYEKAIECFKDIVDNASPDTLASVYYLAANNLSTCYFIMNQLDKAIPLLETVKKATPTLAYTVSQNLSIDYALTGNDKKALERHHCHDALEGIRRNNLYVHDRILPSACQWPQHTSST